MKYFTLIIVILLGGCTLLPEQTPQTFELDTVQTVSQSKKNDLLVYVDYPVASGIDEKLIANWIDDQVSQTRSYLTGDDVTFTDDISPELHGTFEIIPYSSGVSVIYSMYQYVGGAHGSYYIKSFIFNSQGQLQSLSNFIPTISLDQLYSGVLTYATGFAMFDSGMILSGVQEFLDEPVFYPGHDEIIFVFQPYQIAPWSEGSPEITIPRSYFDPKPTPITRPQADSLTGKLIALTFDDGPNNKTTPQLVELLQQHDVVATFYVLGKNVSRFPEIVQTAAAFGHEIGSHSRDHKQFTRLSHEDLLIQKDRTDDIIYQTIGSYPATYRPPYGSKNDEIIALFARPLILRDVDTRDRKYRNADSIVANLGEIQHGDIILFHDIYQSTIDAMSTIITQLQSQGFTFVTVSDLLTSQGITPNSVVVCTSGLRCS